MQTYTYKDRDGKGAQIHYDADFIGTVLVERLEYDQVVGRVEIPIDALLGFVKERVMDFGD